MKTKRYAPSKVIPVRYHIDELAQIDKKRQKEKRTVYIRRKSLQLDK